jgi:thaumarchaeosortase
MKILMSNVAQKVRDNKDTLLKLLPILSFVTPFLILYSLYPSSFEATWKGRTFYLFFLWLTCLEMILSWENVRRSELNRLKSIRTVAFIMALLLPTIYVVVANYFGLNAAIVDLAKKNNVSFNVVDLMPLSTEYLVLAVLFALTVSLGYGIRRLKYFSISALFLGTIGIIYTIDNLYPWGRFTPFQIFVPTTSMLAANVLNMMGYRTTLSFMENHPVYGSLTVLKVQDSHGISTSFPIAWPCSGVESLLIYTVTILLFLKNTPISWRKRIILFAIGALITYFINVLRIATIFIISINTGGGYTPQVEQFHDYYGQLYSIIWIISYPLIIIGSQALWGKIRSWKMSVNMGTIFSSRTRASK